LYNSVSETVAQGNLSPKGTRWAIGTLANTNLVYGACPLEAGNNPGHLIGTTWVVHLTNEDIYLSLKLTAWGGQGGVGNKSFTYVRSTPAPPTPTVSITNPIAGAVFAAPASVSLSAAAAVSSGTITNVTFRTNGVAIGSVLASPFTLSAANLAAGSYALTAVATAAGISATSAVVNVSVVGPVPVVLSGPTLSGGQFSFSYTANQGLSYVVQGSPDLSTWTPIITNVAAGSPVSFSSSFSASSPKFYRVGRLPNP
jgi:hypothetical protein